MPVSMDDWLIGNSGWTFPITTCLVPSSGQRPISIALNLTITVCYHDVRGSEPADVETIVTTVGWKPWSHALPYVGNLKTIDDLLTQLDCASAKP
jgi:hypothetical protein